MRKLSLGLKELLATCVDDPMLTAEAEECGAFATAAQIPMLARTESPMMPARIFRLLRLTEAMVSSPLQCNDIPL